MPRFPIAVLSTGRQDYGVVRSTLVLLREDARFLLRLWVGGMHLKDRFGRTVQMIADDGFSISQELDFVSEPPDPIADTARAAAAVAQVIARDRPDAILLVGDRSETLAAGIAATMERVPLVHLHGGEESEGAIDNAFRHALTKLSHLHLVSHPFHAHRVIQMGEDPERVVVVGAPGLDNFYRNDLPDRLGLEEEVGCELREPVVLVTLHPTTLESDPLREVRAVARAMESVVATYVITLPNADKGGREIHDFWMRWVNGRPRVQIVEALGARRYWGLLRLASAVLGNSSSGIIEAPSAGVPAVNVGDRQRGRLRHPATCDVPPETSAIAEALHRALQPEARALVRSVPPVYPSGPTAPRIVQAIATWCGEAVPRKRFRDIEWRQDL